MGSDRLVGGIAVLAGGVAMTSVTSLAAFFAVGGPFGAINDWTVGILGLLTGLLAFGLSRRDRRTRWVPEDSHRDRGFGSGRRWIGARHLGHDRLPSCWPRGKSRLCPDRCLADRAQPVAACSEALAPPVVRPRDPGGCGDGDRFRRGPGHCDASRRYGVRSGLGLVRLPRLARDLLPVPPLDHVVRARSEEEARLIRSW